MKNIYKNLLLCASVMLCAGGAFATEVEADSTLKPKAVEKRDLGRITGSFETNSIYYTDVLAGSGDPQYGSNNYLKLDYTNGGFSAGFQIEYYPEVLRGYESRLQGIGVPMKYLSYQHSNFSVTVGDYYEQFGSGLLFRSWEDRQLGFNNSIGGARLTFNTDNNAISAKLIYGFPRDYLHSTGAAKDGYTFDNSLFNAYTNTQIYGADLSLSLTQLLFPQSEHNITLEGSGLYRYQYELPPAIEQLIEIFPEDYSHLSGLTNQLSYSARLAYQFRNLSVKGEYVSKGDALSTDYTLKPGNAQLIEANYSVAGLTLSGVFRRLDNMQEMAYTTLNNLLTANTLNYIPALVQAQTYMLAAINPYIPNIKGEIGGQLDLFYNVKRGTGLGGKYGMKIHANTSRYYSSTNSQGAYYVNNKLNYADFNLGVDKTWSRSFKTKFQYSHQEMSADYGESGELDVIDVFVVDATYKFNRKFSLRGELQYLSSVDMDGDWAAALLEANFAPTWSVFVSDMYNVGATKEHYYSVGVSYTKSIMRLAVSYGHNREGQICSGGVCRMQPEYTGANVQLTLLF